MNVPKSHVTIGNGEHCEIRPSGDGVAVEHFRIGTDGAHLWGQDLGSGYATFMNGQVLQPMRPFLFRETDLFRIGESGISFSCQMVHDHTPKAPEPVARQPEPTPVVSDRELKKIEAENERLAREVLNLRHQLKKAQAPTPQEEEEISQVKLNALHEINAMKDVESRRFDKWKRESVEEVERMVITLMQQRNRTKLSKEEISHDVSLALRSTLLGEKINSVSYQIEQFSLEASMAAVILSAAACSGYIYHSKMIAPAAANRRLSFTSRRRRKRKSFRIRPLQVP